MTENRSLSDFLEDGDEDGTDGGTTEAAAPDVDADATPGPESEVEAESDSNPDGSKEDSSSTEAIAKGIDPTGESTDTPGDAVEVPIDSTAVKPASATYAWEPDGGVCGECGDTVAARWRDGQEFVCVDCKEW